MFFVLDRIDNKSMSDQVLFLARAALQEHEERSQFHAGAVRSQFVHDSETEMDRRYPSPVPEEELAEQVI